MTEVQKYIQGAVAVPGVNITSHPRCGDADRQRATDRINEAYARGFIEKEEAEARRDAVSRCTLAAHLDELSRDIPVITRFSGRSLPERKSPRAVLAKEWWQNRQPWTGIGGLIFSAFFGVAPAISVQTAGLHFITPIVAATTIPEAVVVFIMSLISMMCWIDF